MSVFPRRNEPPEADDGGRDSGRGGERDQPPVVVAVVRTGGITGIRRQWRVEPDPPEAPRWVELIEQCPWDAVDADAAGADRFVWTIRARIESDERECDLPDSALDGPWRELVDAVRRAK